MLIHVLISSTSYQITGVEQEVLLSDLDLVLVGAMLLEKFKICASSLRKMEDSVGSLQYTLYML
jgi:hypothetical protein